MLTSAELLSIAEAALAAPSADNCHLFELRASGKNLLLCGNAAFQAAPYHKKVLGRVSFGAVAENIVVRAAALGYCAVVRPQSDPSDPASIAALQLTRAESADAPLDRAIATRQTNRTLRFSGPGLGQPELAAFARLVQDLDGVTLAFAASAEERARVLRLVRIAETERFNTRSMHADLFDAVRFDVGWDASTDTGLAPGSLGIEPGLRSAFALLRHWPVMNALRKIGAHRGLGLRAAHLPCQLAPHLGVLFTRLPIEQGAFPAGRALERIWLEAERQGLAFQPFAAAALLALPGYVDVPAGTRDRLRQGWRELSPDTPVMVFRMGMAKRSRVRSGRPAPAAYLRT